MPFTSVKMDMPTPITIIMMIRKRIGKRLSSVLFILYNNLLSGESQGAVD